MNAPTTVELIFWIAIGIASAVAIVSSLLPWNPHHEAEDPYRYCPKEEK